MNGRIAVPDVLDRFIEYRRKEPVWGLLHIVLEEGNVSDSDVDYCIARAEHACDSEALELARILRQMSRTQRCRIDALATHQVYHIEGRP